MNLLFKNKQNIIEAQFIKSKDTIQVPGPGTYSPSIKQAKGKINPSWSLSKEQRDRLFANNSPGPGSYKIPSKIQEGPQYLLGLKPEINPFKNKTEPGPGLYDPRTPSKSISYSIRKKNNTELSEEKLTPGPGHYGDVRQKYYESIPGSKIGKDLRKQQFLKTSGFDKPPPGTYKTFSFADRASAPKYGFGSSKREKDYISTSTLHTMPPGPGQYQLHSTLGDGTAKATMPGRRPDARPKTGRDAPGAGAYDPDYTKLRHSSPNFNFTKQTRDGEVGYFGNTPGSGSYFAKDILTKTHSASWRIGTEKRPNHQQYVPPTPGPGNYNMNSTLSGPKYHISTKMERQAYPSPGPGNYQVKDSYAKKNQPPQFSVGKQSRIMLKELNSNPGPGSHAIAKNQALFAGPKFGFGSSQRMPTKYGKEPGPGAYKIPVQVANVPQYSMPNREERFKYV